MRVQQEMTSAGLPLNVKLRLQGLIQATDRLCSTTKRGCAATTKRVQAALNEIWEWDPPGPLGPTSAASKGRCLGRMMCSMVYSEVGYC